MKAAAPLIRRWLVPILIFVFGTAGAWGLSQAFRQDARIAWQAQADQTAQALSGTLLGWLEESYAPLSGLGMLAENSTTLTEIEFLNGFDGLESRATAFFLDSAAYLHRDEHDELQLVYSTDTSGPLAAGTSAANSELLKPVVEAALQQPGRLLLGPPFQLDIGTTVSIVALSIVEPDGRPAAVLGLVNYDAMIGGLVEQFVPSGLTLQINGKFLDAGSIPVYTDNHDNFLYTVTTRTISAGADLSIIWHANTEFKGGVADQLAHLTLLSGSLVSAIIALFIGMLLRRNQVISQKIKEATLELERSKDAADAANLAKSEFLANMSHELRTPMNAVLGYSEMLMEEAEDVGQEDFIPDLKKINQAGSHLLSLIDDVLDLSKVESGKMEVFPETFDVQVLIEQVTSTAQPLMANNDNHFSIECDENLGESFQDVTKLRQSLLNILSNAAKFTRQGTIVLRVGRDQAEGREWLRFSVEDTGIGIADEMIDQVFEEFSQADNSTTRKYGGTGLGLSISRRFCELLGGDLTVRSVLEEGSTFTIRVPAYFSSD